MIDLEIQIGIKYHFQHCIIDSFDCIHLFNKSKVSFNPRFDKVSLNNVEIWIDSQKLIHIKGEKECYYYSSYKKNIEEFTEDKPQQRFIKHEEGWKWIGINPYDYVYEWYAMEKTESRYYIMNTLNANNTPHLTFSIYK